MLVRLVDGSTLQGEIAIQPPGVFIKSYMSN